MRIFLILCLGLPFACGDNLQPPTPLEEIVESYESGASSRDDYLSAIAMLDDDGGASRLSGRLKETRLLSARPEPYVIADGFTVAAGAILVIEAGTQLQIEPEATVTVKGRIYAIGTEEQRIDISAPAGAFYTDLLLQGGPNQFVAVDFSRAARTIHAMYPGSVRTIIEDATFNSWVDLAIAQNDSRGLYIYDSSFGYNTPEAEVSGESIRSRDSGLIHIEGSRFSHRTGYRDVIDLQDCKTDDWPVLIGNTFDGGEDDAIDLDNCSAIVIGNYIHNFRPADLSIQDAGINGGGITGDGPGSTPFIANNIVDGCFHGIGFKNGARPAIVHNTVINSNIGITLYQSVAGNPMPDARIYNNLLSNNLGWLDGGANDIVLNGKWWRTYNQVDDIQASAQVQYNITASLPSAYPGTGNLNADPLLDPNSELPRLLPTSPAIDSAGPELSFPDFDLDKALDYLSSDFENRPRLIEQQRLINADRGALER